MNTLRLPIYISLDVETDGPCPGLNSMLSLGAAAFNEAGKLLDSFQANMYELPEARPSPDTQVFWSRHVAAWDAARANPMMPNVAMQGFYAWLSKARLDCSSLTPIAYPAGFDFTWVYYYCHRFLGMSPFAFQCIDLKTYASAILGTEFRRTAKRNMPKDWFKFEANHSHVAVDDAIEQGHMFFRMREYAKGLKCSGS